MSFFATLNALSKLINGWIMKLEGLVYKCFNKFYCLFKGIPSYFFQHFFEIAKRTFIIKGKKLYCTLMCKKFVTFHKSNKKIKFYKKDSLVDRYAILLIFSFRF